MSDEAFLDSQVAAAGLKPTSGQRTLYLAVGGLASVVPVYLFVAIFGQDLVDYAPFYLVGAGLTAALLSQSYHRVTFAGRTALLHKRDHLATRKQLKAEGAKGTQEELDERKRVLNDVTTSEAVAFSLMYTNTFFILVTLVLAFYVVGGYAAPFNYLFSVAGAAVVTYVASA